MGSLLSRFVPTVDFDGVPDVRAGAAHLPESDPWWDVFRGEPTASGKVVTVEGSLGVAAVWAAVRILSDSIGSLPLIVYRTNPDGTRERAPSSRSYGLLHDDPNPEMSAMTLWSLVAVHLNTWGNAYLGKTFRGANVTELWPIKPSRVRVARRRGVKLFYQTDENGRENPNPYTAREIIHIHGLTLDGMLGCSPIALARESIGSAIAMDEYANSFFREGALPRMVLRHKKELSSVAKRNLRRDWERRYRGSRNANRVAVLEEDMDVKVLSLPARDLEFVQQRSHSIQEIARWFRVPSSSLDGDKGSGMNYSNLEMDALYLVTHSIRPWLVRIEQTVGRDPDLFPTRRFFCEFLVDALLRADTKTRYESYAIALDPVKGWMQPAEVRRLENLPTDETIDQRRQLALDTQQQELENLKTPVPAARMELA